MLHLFLKNTNAISILEMKSTDSVLRHPFSGDYLELVCQAPHRRLHRERLPRVPGLRAAGGAWLSGAESLAGIFPQKCLKSYFIGGGEVGRKETLGERTAKKEEEKREKKKRLGPRNGPGSIHS